MCFLWLNDNMTWSSTFFRRNSFKTTPKREENSNVLSRVSLEDSKFELENNFHLGALMGGFLVGGNRELNDLAKDVKLAIS